LGSSADELLGTFPIYDGNQEITFSWNPYPFAAGINGSYRVSLWQNTTPFGATPTWVERKVAHHWASNPNGATFTMGSFGFGEEICTTCPSLFVVQAETVRLFLDAASGSYEYEYTPVASAYALSQTAGGATQTSEEFFFEILRPRPEEREPRVCGLTGWSATGGVNAPTTCSCGRGNTIPFSGPNSFAVMCFSAGYNAAVWNQITGTCYCL
jgi:hypothetical protein